MRPFRPSRFILALFGVPLLWLALWLLAPTADGRPPTTDRRPLTTDGGPPTVTPTPTATTDGGPPTVTPAPAPTMTPPADYRAYLPAVIHRRETLRYAWTRVHSPTTTDLYSIAMLSSTHGWAVGRGGVILRWDGHTWSQVENVFIGDIRPSLLSVSVISPTEAWAVTLNGLILRWNGSTWAEVEHPNVGGLRSITMVSATDGWAVGGFEPFAFILHWNGQTWQITYQMREVRLTSVTMASPTDGWAVGYHIRWDGRVWVDGASLILRWNGLNWQPVSSPDVGPLYDVAAIAPNAAWAVGWHSAILWWDGQTWAAFSRPDLTSLNAISMVSSSEGWAVGFSYVLNREWTSQIWRWDGSHWTQVSGAPVVDLYSIDMISATEGWAVGRFGAIVRYGLSRIPWP